MYRSAVFSKVIILIVSILVLLGLTGYFLVKKDPKMKSYLPSFINQFSEMSATYKENQSLKARLANKEVLAAESSDLKRDNETLSAILNKKNTLHQNQVIQAAVLYREPGSWFNMIVLNKGSNDGVKQNMSVITSTGLLGKIETVNPTQSIVTLLSNNNTDMRVSAYLQDTSKIFGLINGYDNKKNVLLLKGLSNDAKVKKGDKVLTSGLGGVYPPGLEIGEVTEVVFDEYGLTKIAQIKPYADFNDISDCLIVN